MKCLEKDRSRRYETANGLARDVERYLADESVEACPPSAGYRLRKFVRRNRGPVLAASIIFLLLVGGIVGTTWGLIRADRARKAEADRAEGEKNGQREGAEAAATDRKGERDPGVGLRRSRPSRRRRRKAGRCGRSSATGWTGRPPIWKETRSATPSSWPICKIDWAGRTGPWATPPRRRRCSRRPSRSAEPSSDADDPDTLAVMSQQASALIRRRRVERSHRPVRAGAGRPGCEFSGPIIGTPSPPGDDLAVAYWKAGRSNEACALLEQVRDALLQELGPDDAQTIDALDRPVRGVRDASARATEAIALAEQVRDARVKQYGVDHHLAIVSLNNLAARYQAAGKMRQALALFEEARDEIVPRLGAEHPTSLNILDSLARMYRAFGTNDRGNPLGRAGAGRARDDSRSLPSGHHPHTG